MTEQTHAGMSGGGKELFVREKRGGKTSFFRGAIHSLQWLLIFVFALAAGAANAGYYTVTYSDGTYTLDVHGPINDSGSNGGWGGGGFSAFSASCQGEITATFAWHQNDSLDLPPHNVIVEENSYAQAVYFGAVPGRVGSATASNGLGTAPVTVVDAGTGGTLYTTTSSGTKYTIIKSPGASFKMFGKPSASSSDGGGYCTASVLYTAIPHVVRFVVAGPVVANGSDNVLIGQGCEGMLTADGISLRNFHWIALGDTFKSYEAHGYYTGHFARFTPMAAADWTAPTPSWYWRSDGNPLVSVSADAYDNNNNFIGTVGDLKLISVWCPYYYCNILKGNVQVYADTPSTRMLSAGTPAFEGITWTGNVVPDVLFTAAIGNGLWSFVQIFYPGRSYTDSSGTHTWSINGQVGLDDSYPYAPDQSIPQQDNNDIGHADNHTEFSAYDRPGSPLFDTMLSYSVNENFKTYMMYRPAATTVGNQWVPLHRVSWNWTANVTRPGNSWSNGILPWLLGPVTSSEDARCKTHPLWEVVLIAPTAPFIP